jgi:predicted PurR-regulated permease PerM
LMAAGINELNLNTHLYLLQLFKYAQLVIWSSRRVSCHGVKYCILILVIVFFSVMICIRQFSVTEQVDYLLRQATSIDNLSNMYEGWTPWIWERQQGLQSSEWTTSEADLLIHFEGSWKSIIGGAGVYFCVPLSAPKVKDWN